MRLSLPFPPTVNTYRAVVRNRLITSKKGREYKQTVIGSVGLVDTLEGRLSVVMMIHPPDKRRRDLDNLTKPLLDALQEAGVYADDSQIDKLLIRRCETIKGGRVDVLIERIA